MSAIPMTNWSTSVRHCKCTMKGKILEISKCILHIELSLHLEYEEAYEGSTHIEV